VEDARCALAVEMREMPNLVSGDGIRPGAGTKWIDELVDLD